MEEWMPLRGFKKAPSQWTYLFLIGMAELNLYEY